MSLSGVLFLAADTQYTEEIHFSSIEENVRIRKGLKKGTRTRCWGWNCDAPRQTVGRGSAPSHGADGMELKHRTPTRSLTGLSQGLRLPLEAMAERR